MIDTHCHLCDRRFDRDRQQVFDRAHHAGVTHLVEVAYAPEIVPKAHALAAELATKPVTLTALHCIFRDIRSTSKWHARCSVAVKIPGGAAMNEGWIFQGWLYQKGDGEKRGPVSDGELLELLAKRRLMLGDIVYKQYAREGEKCISSPITLKDAMRTG